MKKIGRTLQLIDGTRTVAVADDHELVMLLLRGDTRGFRRLRDQIERRGQLRGLPARPAGRRAPISSS